MSIVDPAVKDLAKALMSFDTRAELLAFLEDLCTPAELSSLADRWRVVGLLDEGLPYREINLKTGVSTATVTRVARSLSLGSGYRQALIKESKK